MANENINDIKERVGALLRKAADPACSEAEADGAMRLAQKLMEKYQVTEADLAVGGNAFKELDRVGTLHKKTGEYYLHPVERYCAVIVGRFCAVKPYTVSDEGALKLRLFGLESDVELATWMLTAFVQQFESDWERFKKVELGSKRFVTIKDARLSFARGFCDAVNKRLNDWLYRRENDIENSPTEGTSNALIIKKFDLVEQELRKRGVHLSRANHRGNAGNHEGARGAGYMSGSRAETGRSVGGGAIMIGAR